MKKIEKNLVDSCIFWHVRPHRQVFLEALAAISPTFCFDKKKVLELSATHRSTLSPFLVACGAHCMVTYYQDSESFQIKKTISRLIKQYNLEKTNFSIDQLDVFTIDGKNQYDLILINYALGGYNREHNLDNFRKVVANCFLALKPNGNLLIIDKGRSLSIINLILKKFGTAGSNGWHYFSRDDLSFLVPNETKHVSFFAHGVFSFGDFGGGILQKIADLLDKHLLEKIIRPENRAIFAFLISKLE